MYETIIAFNADEPIATVIIKGNNPMFDYLQRLIVEHPDKCTQIEDGYTVPRSWIRILPYLKK